MILYEKRCPITESTPLYLCGSKLEEAAMYKYLSVLVNKNLETFMCNTPGLGAQRFSTICDEVSTCTVLDLVF